jgi:hypothetical protein
MELPVIEMIDDAMVPVLKSKSPAERLKIAGMLFNSAKKLISISLRQRFPHWDEGMIEKETLIRISHGSH